MGTKERTEPKTAEAPVLWNVATVAEYFGVTTAAIYQRIARREIPFIRVGRAVYVPRDRLLQFLADRLVDPDAQDQVEPVTPPERGAG
jgi:excisionase family DNA binding protein